MINDELLLRKFAIGQDENELFFVMEATYLPWDQFDTKDSIAERLWSVKQSYFGPYGTQEAAEHDQQMLVEAWRIRTNHSLHQLFIKELST